MKYKITYLDIHGKEQEKIEDTKETKERLMQHAHVVKVSKVGEKKEKVAKKKK